MLTTKEIDALKELINIGMGKGAEVLNDILNHHILLKIPILTVLKGNELNQFLSDEYKDNLSGINMKFRGEMNGDVELIFNTTDALKMVSIFRGIDKVDDEFDEVMSESLCELGNIVINAVMGTLSNIMGLKLKYVLPVYLEGNLQNFLSHIPNLNETVILLAKTHFIIKDLDINGFIMLFFSLKEFSVFVKKINEFDGSGNDK